MKAFVISLSKVPSSIDTATTVVHTLLGYGFDAVLFEGTYGNDAVEMFKSDGRTIAKYGIKSKKTPIEIYHQQNPGAEVPPGTTFVTEREAVHNGNKMMRAGVIGCFYSHYRLWKKCVELNESIFIFEDDVIFERNYIPVRWDDILLVCTGKAAYKHDFYKELLYSPAGMPSAIPLRNTSMPGAVGYGITPSAARKLVEAYAVEFLPADNAINSHVVKLQCHNYLMGRAALAEDGKVSLTASKYWNKK